MTPDQYAHIIKKLQDIEDLLLERKPKPKTQLHPSTMVIEVCSKAINETFTATAVRMLLPSSERSGERKAVAEASLHQALPTESTIMAMGKILQIVGLQNPKKLLIRVACDEEIVDLIRYGMPQTFTPVYFKKAEYLVEDIENLRKRIDVQVESFASDSPECDELMGLLFEAQEEYYQRQEKENEPRSTRDSTDQG